MTKIRDYDPRAGLAAQGDIVFMPMPRDVAIATHDEIKPSQGRLIIQEGEQSGHHHAIALPARHFRPATPAGDPVLKTRSRKLRQAFGGKAASARMYRDPGALEALRGRGLLTRTDLAIGCLIVEGDAVVVAHEEHDGIRLPAGRYYVGRQVESAGAEERVVAD